MERQLQLHKITNEIFNRKLNIETVPTLTLPTQFSLNETSQSIKKSGETLLDKIKSALSNKECMILGILILIVLILLIFKKNTTTQPKQHLILI